MLFNASLESAFREWQSKLTEHGFLLSPDTTRLTNVRYADDVMLFAKTAEELIQIVELLIEAFGKVGLELNAVKSTNLTNDCQLDPSSFQVYSFATLIARLSHRTLEYAMYLAEFASSIHATS